MAIDMCIRRVSFESRLQGVLHGKRGLRLLAPFIVRVVFVGGASVLYVIPAGFTTDFASIPRLPFVYLLLGGRAQEEATFHDYLYRRGVLRAFSDWAFFKAMKGREKLWVRVLMWLGVRLFGWMFWKGKR